MESRISAPGLDVALDWWNWLAGRPLFVRTTGGGQITVDAAGPICAPGCAAPVWAGDGQFHNPPAYPYIACSIYLSESTGVVAGAWPIVAHELGHCLGFAHLYGVVSVMNESPSPNPGYDQSMLAAAGYR